MRLFPEAKVILTTREPESWIKSSIDTLYTSNQDFWHDPAVKIITYLLGYSRLFHMIKLYCYGVPPDAGVDRGYFQALEGEQEEAVQFFNDWEQGVRDSVEPDRLLVFRPQEGWEPLCRFVLDPILRAPEEPFPRMNDSDYLKRMRIAIKVASYFIVFGLPVLLLCFFVAFMCHFLH